MEYRTAFEYTTLVHMFLINNASRMDSCSSFINVSRMVDIVEVYTHAQV